MSLLINTDLHSKMPPRWLCRRVKARMFFRVPDGEIRRRAGCPKWARPVRCARMGNGAAFWSVPAPILDSTYKAQFIPRVADYNSSPTVRPAPETQGEVACGQPMFSEFQ